MKSVWCLPIWFVTTLLISSVYSHVGDHPLFCSKRIRCRPWIPWRHNPNQWLYDVRQGRCRRARLSLCSEVATFASSRACRAACGPSRPMWPDWPPEVVLLDPAGLKEPDHETMFPRICKLPPLKSPGYGCKANFPRFTFNWSTKKCVPYAYGGCRKALNVFKTMKSCMDICMPEVKPPNCIMKPGQQPYIIGWCKGIHCRPPGSYVYDEKTKTCVQDARLYQGREVFWTKKKCEKACLRPGTTVKRPGKCLLPPENNIGGISCMAYIPKFTFNSAKQRCERYVYGGCGGTANLYDTKRECVNTCITGVSPTRLLLS